MADFKVNFGDDKKAEPKVVITPPKTEVGSIYAGKSETWIKLIKFQQDHPALAAASVLFVGTVVGSGLALIFGGGSARAQEPRVENRWSGAAPPRAPTPNGGTLTVETRRTWQGKPMPAKLRAAPDGPQKALVPNGTVVTVQDRKEVGPHKTIWYLVSTPSGESGWMHWEVLK